MTIAKNGRLALLAFALIFISTLSVLLARRLNMGPMSPVPAWRTFGPENAAIQIYEFTDFACPACRGASETLTETLRVYGGDIRLRFKHYPLIHIHPWSMHAAAYSDCAGEQGKFTEYAELLFATQENWGEAKEEPAIFGELALKLKLDWPKMQACANSPEAIRRVKLDMAEGDLKGVNAPPTFFINGKRSVGGGQLLDKVRNFDNLLGKKR